MSTSLYEPGHDPRNADDSPDYGTVFSTGWGCDDWKTWFYSLKKKYPNQAVTIWDKSWNDLGFWSLDYSFCKYEPTFNAMLETEGLQGNTNILANTTVAVQNSVKTAGDVLTNGLETVNKMVTSINEVSSWLIPGAALLLLIIVATKANKAIA